MSLKEALQDMFLVFGAAPPDRVEAFTRTVGSDASCSACFERTARLAAKGPKAPTPASFLTLYRDTFENDHRDHIGQDVLEVSAGAQEAFWRSKATAIIKPRVGGDSDLASFIAGHMWWLQFEPDLELISAEFAPGEASGEMWVAAARSFLTAKDVPLQIQRIYAMARRNAIAPVSGWSEAEWDAMTGIGAATTDA
jgi:hypothetical protein